MRKEKRMHDVLIIIPAWNEGAVLGSVLREVRSSVDSYADILVVSDGSLDDTAQIAADAGVAVLDLPLNLGVGGAMRAGYTYAHRCGYRYAVQLDADGQHDPAAIPDLLEVARTQKANVVIGARFAGKGDYTVRGPRQWAMKMLSVVLSRVVGTKLTDTTSGFKLSDRVAFSIFAHDYPAEYLGDTIEALVIAARAGLTVTQVPVEMRPRAGGVPSHNPLKAARFLMRACMALTIALTRPYQRPLPTQVDAIPPSGLHVEYQEARS